MSRIKIEFLSLLSELVDKGEVEIPIKDKISLESLIKKMTDRFGDEFKRKLLDENGNLHKFILLVVNGNRIPTPEEKDYLIHGGDEISFIPAIAGG